MGKYRTIPHRLTLNKGGGTRPLERGTKNNKLTWTHRNFQTGKDFELAPGRVTKQLFKKIRNKKRRMFDKTEVPGI